ncbi:uncharacterized protein V6R79_009866 [Siganus canaliculatus]
MARAETIESVEETGGRGNGLLPHHSTCRMEVPGLFHTWPSVLATTTTTTTTSGSGAATGGMHLRHNHHDLQPAAYLSYGLFQPRAESQEEPQTPSAAAPSAAAPSSPRCSPRAERPDSDRVQCPEEDYRDRQGPLPDLLPQNEHPSWASPRHRGSQEQQEVRRVAAKLRAIGDDYNATVLRRAHAAPHWPDWRDACRGLLTFLSHTLSALYRLT